MPLEVSCTRRTRNDATEASMRRAKNQKRSLCHANDWFDRSALFTVFGSLIDFIDMVELEAIEPSLRDCSGHSRIAGLSDASVMPTPPATTPIPIRAWAKPVSSSLRLTPCRVAQAPKVRRAECALDSTQRQKGHGLRRAR